MPNRIIFGLLLVLLTVFSGCVSTQENTKEAATLKMQIGVTYLEKNNLPMALKELLEAVALDESNALIHNNLGLVYFLRKKYDLSVKHFHRATELNPSFTEAKNNLARIYIEIRQYKKAQELLKIVSDDLTYTNMGAAYMNYGLMYFNQRKFEPAKNYFKQVLQISREDCYAHVYLGRSYLELGDTKTAASQLDKSTGFCKAQKIDEGHYYSAIAYYRLGARDKSLARFEEVSILFPDGPHFDNSKKMIQLIEKGVE